MGQKKDNIDRWLEENTAKFAPWTPDDLEEAVLVTVRPALELPKVKKEEQDD